MSTNMYIPLDDLKVLKDTSGRYRIRSLFIEGKQYVSNDTLKPIYSLGNEPEKEGCISLRLLYMEEMDPTEYTFAMKAFGSWDHWKRITESAWFYDNYLKHWREELEIKLKALGIKTVLEKSLEGGRDALTASKYIAEFGWEPKARGRKPKDTQERDQRIKKGIQNDVEDDYERIMGDSVSTDVVDLTNLN